MGLVLPRGQRDRLISEITYSLTKTAMIDTRGGDASRRKPALFSVVQVTPAGGSPTGIRADAGYYAK